MRDPQRIEEIQSLIQSVWINNPDLRYMQLLYILQSGYSESNNNYGKVLSMEQNGFERIGYDMFNLEDEEFMSYLIKVVENGL